MTVSVLRLARKLPKMKLSDKEVIELNELLDRLVENNLSYDQKKATRGMFK